MSETHRWISGISALFGAWVFVSAFVFEMTGAHYWNDLIAGAAIVALAGYGAAQTDVSGTGKTWTAGLAALLGLWMIATPFVYGATSTAMWSAVISGVAVAALSGYNAYEANRTAGTPTTEGTGT